MVSACAEKKLSVAVDNVVFDALGKVSKIGEESVVLICGSLYLAGSVLGKLDDFKNRKRN